MPTPRNRGDNAFSRRGRGDGRGASFGGRAVGGRDQRDRLQGHDSSPMPSLADLTRSQPRYQHRSPPMNPSKTMTQNGRGMSQPYTNPTQTLVSTVFRQQKAVNDTLRDHVGTAKDELRSAAAATELLPVTNESKAVQARLTKARTSLDHVLLTNDPT